MYVLLCIHNCCVLYAENKKKNKTEKKTFAMENLFFIIFFSFFLLTLLFFCLLKAIWCQTLALNVITFLLAIYYSLLFYHLYSLYLCVFVCLYVWVCALYVRARESAFASFVWKSLGMVFCYCSFRARFKAGEIEFSIKLR